MSVWLRLTYALSFQRRQAALRPTAAVRVSALGVAVLASTAFVGSCSSSGIGGASPPVSLCGASLWHGAAVIFPDQTGRPRSGPHPPAPPRSELPPQTRKEFSGIPLLVQVSPSCSQGRIVRVLGAAGVQTMAVAHSTDGLIAGFALEYTSPGPPIDILVYSGRRLVGQLVVRRS